MGDILTGTSDYNAIRVKMGVTTDDLPDVDVTTIGLLAVAEAQIESLVTDWAAIMAGSSPNKVFLQAATLCLCGALAVRKVELQRGQDFSIAEYRESKTAMEWDNLRCELMGECKTYLALISTHVHTAPKLLVVAGPTSSGANWPTRIDRWMAKIQPHLATWLDTNGVRRFGWENQP